MQKNTFFRRAIFLLGLLVFGPSLVFSQRIADVKRYAETLFEAGRWHEALDNYSRYQTQKPGELDVLLRLGICSYQTHAAADARRFLNYVIDQKGDAAEPEAFYWMARTLHGQSEFRAAILYYKLFLKHASERNGLRANAIDNIKRCVAGMQLVAAPSDALVENLGENVNSFGDDFAPVPSPLHPERLYFSAAREGNTGGLRDENGLESAEKGHFTADMFGIELDGGVWSAPGPLGSLLNSPRHEQVLDFSENGQTLYFFRGFSLFSGEILTDTASSRDELRAEPTPIFSPMRPEMGDCAPFFFNDSMLLFASRRDGGQGGLDLYFSTFSKQKRAWSEPENLGPTINSGYDETTPFLAKDGRTLFFSSNNLNSMGGLDLFSAKMDDKTVAWSKPKNLGAPINSPGDDAFFRLAVSGTEAYFSSDRLDALGGRDLYVAHFKKEKTEMRERSNPLVFSQLERPKAEAVVEIPTELLGRDTSLQPIFYENDRDLSSPANLKRMDGFVALAKALPQAKIIVTCHTDDTDPAKFALYYGIKRAEQVAKILTEKGLDGPRIWLRSAGLQYPIAKNVVNAEPNVAGKRLNRRIELTLAAPDLPLKIGIERPIVNEIMAADGAEFFDEMNKGLVYRVQVATTRQILSSDELMMFGDLLIESTATSGQYAYLAGLFKTSSAAADLRRELIGQGFDDARIVAFVNGVRVSKEEAKSLVKTYPDLSFWLEKN